MQELSETLEDVDVLMTSQRSSTDDLRFAPSHPKEGKEEEGLPFTSFGASEYSSPPTLKKLSFILRRPPNILSSSSTFLPPLEKRGA